MSSIGGFNSNFNFNNSATRFNSNLTGVAAPGFAGFNPGFGVGGTGIYGGSGFNSFANPYAFGGGFGGFGGVGFGGAGAAGWGILAANIGFLIGTIIQNAVINRDGGEEGCCECSGEKGAHDNKYESKHFSYVDGPSEHRWEEDGFNMNFEVDY